jgi:hypothetical protein
MLLFPSALLVSLDLPSYLRCSLLSLEATFRFTNPDHSSLWMTSQFLGMIVCITVCRLLREGGREYVAGSHGLSRPFTTREDQVFHDPCRRAITTPHSTYLL